MVDKNVEVYFVEGQVQVNFVRFESSAKEREIYSFLRELNTRSLSGLLDRPLLLIIDWDFTFPCKSTRPETIQIRNLFMYKQIASNYIVYKVWLQWCTEILV